MIRLNRSTKKDIRAVSEVIGTILMLGISTVIVSSVALWSSDLIQDAQDYPHLEYRAELEGKTLVLTHEEGELVPSSDSMIRVMVVDDDTGSTTGPYLFNLADGQSQSPISWSITESWSRDFTSYLSGIDRGHLSVAIFQNSTNTMIGNEIRLDFNFQRDTSILPDLVISDLEFDTLGEDAKVGEPIAISVLVSNIGGGNITRNITVQFSDGDIIIGTSTIVANATDPFTYDWNGAGYGNRTLNLNWMPTKWGKRPYQANVFFDGYERTQSNNQITEYLDVIPTPQAITFPNLIISAINLADTSPVHGETQTIEVIIQNTGSTGISQADGVSLLIEDSIGSTLWNKTVSVAGLGQYNEYVSWVANPGGEVTLNFTVLMGDYWAYGQGLWEPSTDPGATPYFHKTSRSLVVLPTILFVDDDGGSNQGDYVKEALVACGVTPDEFTVVGNSEPRWNATTVGFHHYDIVIWTTGLNPINTISSACLNDLEYFLDNGGKLWLISQDFLSDSYSPETSFLSGSFPYDYLGVNGYSESSLEASANGIIDSPISNNLTLSDLSNINAMSDRTDVLTLAPGGEAVINQSVSSQEYIAVAKEWTPGPNLTAKTVFCSFDYSSIVDPFERSELAFNILNWFGWRIAEGYDFSIVTQSLSPTDPTFLDTMKVSATIRNNGPQDFQDVGVAFYIKHENQPWQLIKNYTGEEDGSGAPLKNPMFVDLPGDGDTVSINKEWLVESVGTFTFMVRVDYNNVYSEINENNNDITYSEIQVVEIVIPYSILVVDDDDSANNGNPSNPEDTTENITEALSYLGYDHKYMGLNQAYVVGSGNDGPDLEVLKKYNTVIWSCGNASTNTLTDTDRANLASYLNGSYAEASIIDHPSVNLWVIGQDILDDVEGPSDGSFADTSDELLRDIMMVGQYQTNTSTPSVIRGIYHDEISHGMEYPTQDLFTDRGDAMKVKPSSQGELFITSPIIGADAGQAIRAHVDVPNIGYNNQGGEYNTVFMSFEYAFIKDVMDGDPDVHSREDIQALPVFDQDMDRHETDPGKSKDDDIPHMHPPVDDSTLAKAEQTYGSQPSTRAVVFSDNFDRADSNDVGNGWLDIQQGTSGTMDWDIVDGMLYHDNRVLNPGYPQWGGAEIIQPLTVFDAEYTFQFNGMSNDNGNRGGLGFIFRRADSNNMYRFHADPNTDLNGGDSGNPDMTLEKKYLGNWQILDTSGDDYSRNTWYSMKITTTGNTIQVDMKEKDPDLVCHLKFDENSGDTCNDMSNFDNPGSRSGASWTSGRFGYALDFDGSNDRVDIDDSNDINNMNVYTRSYSLWFNADDTVSRQVIYKEGGGSHGLSMYLHNNRLYCGFWSTNRITPTWMSTPFTDTGSTHHLAFTFDSTAGVQKMLLDNVEVDSASETGYVPSHSGNIRIGRSDTNMDYHDGETGSSCYYDGMIDEFRIYNRYLSDTEVQTLFEGGDVDSGSYTNIFDYTDNSNPIMSGEFGFYNNNYPHSGTHNSRYLLFDNLVVNSLTVNNAPVLNNGDVTPDGTGYVTSAHTFTVQYKDDDDHAPQAGSPFVTIGGTPYAMSLDTGAAGYLHDGDYTNWEQYTYTAAAGDIAKGDTSYQFDSFDSLFGASNTDGPHTLTVLNSAPVLEWVPGGTLTGYGDDGDARPYKSVEPDEGQQGSITVKFRVVYTDADDDEPSVYNIYVDGTPTAMNGGTIGLHDDDLTPGSQYDNDDYTDGEIFWLGRSTLSGTPAPGVLHQCYFDFSDTDPSSSESDRLPASGTEPGPYILPPNQPPVISFSSEEGYGSESDGLEDDLGTEPMTYTYKIVVTDSDSSSVTVRVHIDGDATGDVMNLDTGAEASLHDGDLTNGEQYYLDVAGSVLGLGSHDYYFTAVDDAADSDREPPDPDPPFNGPTISTVSVYLESGSVSPPVGGTATVFTYRVKYTNTDNQPPSSIKVYIDTVPFNMVEEDPGDITYSDGKWYINTTTLSSGNHNYYFYTTYSSLNDRLPAFGADEGPLVGGKSLESPSVTPMQGHSTSEFTYQVIFNDHDNTIPAVARIYIDDTPYDMEKDPADDTSSDGIIYTYQKTGLTKGIHEYRFEFTGVRLPSFGNYQGPIVSGAAASVGQDGAGYEAELAFLILRWFGQPEDRAELKVSNVDLQRSENNPTLGNRFLLSVDVYNYGGSDSSALVQFWDGSSIISSIPLAVPSGNHSQVETLWTPSFSGNRVLRVTVDPYRDVSEIFNYTNNVAQILDTYVYMFHDDMERGPKNWEHESTVLRITGESPVEFMDDIGTVYTDVAAGWAEMEDFHRTPPEYEIYHSYGTSFFINDTQPANDKYLTSPTFSLEGVDSAVLSFYHRYNMTTGVNGVVVLAGSDTGSGFEYDYMIPSKSSYNNNIHTGYTFQDDKGRFMRYAWNGVSDKGEYGWDYVEVDLKNYTGLSQVRVQIRFLYAEDTDPGNYYIDDVVVRTSRSDATAVTAAGSDQWQITNTDSSSGSRSWWLASPDTGYLKGGIDSSLVSRSIDLTKAEDATLFAKIKFNVNMTSGRPPDCIRLEISTDSVQWTPLCDGVRGMWGVSDAVSDESAVVNNTRYDNGILDGKTYMGVDEDGDGWINASTLLRVQTNLTGYAGQVIWLRFRVVTASDSNPFFGDTHYEDGSAGFGGFYLDDVYILGRSSAEDTREDTSGEKNLRHCRLDHLKVGTRCGDISAGGGIPDEGGTSSTRGPPPWETEDSIMDSLSNDIGLHSASDAPKGSQFPVSFSLDDLSMLLTFFIIGIVAHPFWTDPRGVIKHVPAHHMYGRCLK